MGGCCSGKRDQTFENAVRRAEQRSAKVFVSGRYHRLPHRIGDDYNIEKTVLGTGFNGSVVRATSKRTSCVFAVKCFRLRGVSGKKRSQLEAEAEIFLSMDHPHIARLVDVYEQEGRLFLVMECMTGGELFERVQKKRRFTEIDAAHAVSEMLRAVNYIHMRGVVHRDLKLENFLYEDKSSDHLKLIDFGFSHVWEPNTTMASSVGTLPYMAPEVLHQRSTSKKCDMWSMGVITFILLAGYMPFGGGEAEQIASIKSGRWLKKPDRWVRISDQAKDFVAKLIVVDADQRLSAEQALKHPYIEMADDRRVASPVDTSVVDALQAFAEVSHFRRACMSVMAWSLTAEEARGVRDAFLSIDLNKEGTITLGELKQCLSEKIDITDEQVKPIFDAIDVGQNEEIHYSEFLAAMMTSRISMNDDLLINTFRRFDTDKSGYITTENLQHVLGTHFAGADVSKLIREAGFRDSDKISEEEFIRYLKGGHSPDNEETHCKWQSAAASLIDETEAMQAVPSRSDSFCRQSSIMEVMKAFEPHDVWRHDANVKWRSSRDRYPGWRGCLSGIATCCQPDGPAASLSLRDWRLVARDALRAHAP